MWRTGASNRSFAWSTSPSSSQLRLPPACVNSTISSASYVTSASWSASSGSSSPVSPAASMPSSSRRSTVSSCTASARSIAGSGSARKKRRRLLRAGATTSTSALLASSSPTAARSASAETGSATRARIRLAIPGLIPQCAPRQSEGEDQLDAGERQLERALRQFVGEEHPEDHPGGRQRGDDQPVAHAHVAVAVLAPSAHERHRDDREQRRGLGAELREPQEEDESGHEHDAAAEPGHARESARRDADCDGAGDVHQAISIAAETTRTTASSPDTARGDTRCCSQVPASTPPT